jgi:hypothetical protein
MAALKKHVEENETPVERNPTGVYIYEIILSQYYSVIPNSF